MKEESNKSRFFCRIPTVIIDEIDVYMKNNTSYKKYPKFFEAFFDLYSLENYKLSTAKIALYQTYYSSGDKTISLYLPNKIIKKLTIIAEINLRPIKEQMIHFIFFIFDYLKRMENNVVV